MIPSQEDEAHQSQWRSLMAARNNSRLSHAYLFFGPEGTGKKQLALTFAQALNCSASENPPCGTCLSCIKVERRTHPDVNLIQAEGEQIKIDQIRELQRDIFLPPLEGFYKVYILDEAERMTLEAANCLLKTLEEPSSYALLILVSARPHLLPATVASRCQKLRFKPLGKKTVAQILTTQGVAKEEATILAALSGGSLAVAGELKDGEILRERQALLPLLTGSEPAGARVIFELSQRWAKEGERAELLLRLLMSWFRDLLALRDGAGEEILINQDELAALKQAQGRYSRDRLLSIFQDIIDAQEALARKANKQLTLNMLLWKTIAEGR